MLDKVGDEPEETYAVIAFAESVPSEFRVSSATCKLKEHRNDLGFPAVQSTHTCDCVWSEKPVSTYSNEKPRSSYSNVGQICVPKSMQWFIRGCDTSGLHTYGATTSALAVYLSTSYMHQSRYWLASFPGRGRNSLVSSVS